MEMFPIAYHHAVHSQSANANGDFHTDYKNCLMHSFSSLSPFGDLPSKIAYRLSKSVEATNVFTQALDRGAEILASTEEIGSDYLTEKCRHQLMKMTFCPQCNGLSKQRAKSCHGYCSNVMR